MKHLDGLGHKGKCLGLLETRCLSEDPKELEPGIQKWSNGWLCLVILQGCNKTHSMNEERKKREKCCIKERAVAKVKCHCWGTMKDKLAKKEATVPLFPGPGQFTSFQRSLGWQVLRGSQMTKRKHSSKSLCPEVTKLVGLELEDNGVITNTEI